MRLLGASFSYIPFQLKDCHVHIPLFGIGRTTIGEAEHRGGGGSDYKEGRAGSAGAVGTGSEIYTRLKVGGPVVAGRNLHVVWAVKNTGNLVGHQVITWSKAYALQICLDYVPGAVGDIREQGNHTVPGERKLGIYK